MLHNEPGTKKAQIVETHDLTQTDNAAGPERAKWSRYKRAVVRGRQQGPSISSLANDTNTPESTMSFFPSRETQKDTLEDNLKLIHVIYSGPHVPSSLKEQEMRNGS